MRILTTLFLLAAALVAVDTQAATPAKAPPIVFATGALGPMASRTDIYVRNGDGAIRRLTRTDAYEGFPSWSPDRRRIVYSRTVDEQSDIYVMNANGTGVRRLAGSRRGPQDLYPAWSPDGKLIAFSSNRFGEPDIFVMRADGTGLRRLTVTPKWVTDTNPRFSPDGKHIVFASNRSGFANMELYRVRVSDGRGLKRLTFWGSDDLHELGDDLLPDYSPDGKRIAFVSDRDGDGGYAIWTMRASDGKDVRRVISHPGRNVVFPRWSPDGRSLLYTTFSNDDVTGDFRIHTVPAGGGTPTEVARGSEADW